MFDRLAGQGPPVINTLSTCTRRWAIGLAAMPLLLGVFGSGGRPVPSPDSGLSGCTALASTHQLAAADYPAISAHFAGSRWPDLRFSGMAYVEIATKLCATHAYGGETAWFYQRLSAACAKHGHVLPF
jgi:hypothetical protein